jgi:hypothetical protein
MNDAVPNYWLLAAGWGSVAASLLHVACVFGGPDWYRFLGAGEKIAQAAARGSWGPTLITLAIAAVLMVWAAYAFSAAGLFVRLPFARTALVLIAVVLLLRALLFFVRDSWRPDLSFEFMLWSSLIVFALGLCFAIGTWRASPVLSE